MRNLNINLCLHFFRMFMTLFMTILCCIQISRMRQHHRHFTHAREYEHTDETCYTDTYKHFSEVDIDRTAQTARYGKVTTTDRHRTSGVRKPIVPATDKFYYGQVHAKASFTVQCKHPRLRSRRCHSSGQRRGK